MVVAKQVCRMSGVYSSGSQGDDTRHSKHMQTCPSTFSWRPCAPEVFGWWRFHRTREADPHQPTNWEDWIAKFGFRAPYRTWSRIQISQTIVHHQTSFSAKTTIIVLLYTYTASYHLCSPTNHENTQQPFYTKQQSTIKIATTTKQNH